MAEPPPPQNSFGCYLPNTFWCHVFANMDEVRELMADPPTRQAPVPCAGCRGLTSHVLSSRNVPGVGPVASVCLQCYYIAAELAWTDEEITTALNQRLHRVRRYTELVKQGMHIVSDDAV